MTAVDIDQGLLRLQAKVEKGTSLQYKFTISGPDTYNKTFDAGFDNFHEFTPEQFGALSLGKIHIVHTEFYLCFIHKEDFYFSGSVI